MNETPGRLQPGRLATTRFVPALVRDGAAGPVPRAERFGAVLLFVDAAGFSRLTAGLVADDRRGAVEVGRIVNAHFGRLVDRVAAHGGAVQAIAGDALIALWPFAGDGAGAVARAKACGAEILAAAGNLADRQLPVRAVVDAGEVWLGRLGDDHERLAVAAGPLVERMGGLSALWHEGRVVATEAARLLAEGDAAAETGGPDHAQDASDPGAYVPTLVRDLLSAAQPEWLSEFRAVSVLFARFDGWSSGAPGALERLERLAAGCRAALGRHDGRLLQFMVDDKGLILLAAWGLPGNTTEEDAARAVRAAEEVLAHAAAKGLGAGIGVTTGRAFTGVVGGAAFCHYTIVGTVVNDAAFLMRQRPGVTCDAATEAAAAAIHRFEPLGPVRFKGAASPEEVFVPRGPRTRAESDRAALVGRAAERARIDAALARPEGGVVWISGEPGIGKSHLADAIRRDLGARDVPCLSAVAESLEARLPYAALRPLFERLLGAGGVTAAALSEDPRLGAVPDLAGRLPLLADLFGFEAQETAFVAALQAAARPTETRRILADLFAALAPDGRFALFVEDVHWLETSSWLLLALLRRQVPRMAIVLTSRRIAPESLPEEAAAFLSDPGVVAAPLQRLGEVEAERLVHQTLAAESVPQEVTRRIFARAEGHPYYTKALATSMLQRGLLRSRDGHCYLAAEVRSLSKVAFPDTIQGAIAARVSALGPAAQLTLKVASVEGRIFELAQVAAIHPDAPDVATVEAHFADAAALELVEPGPGAGLLQFHHALARDTVYDLLVEEQRRVLHAAAAQRHAEAVAQPSDLVLAHHWEEAGEPRRAIHHLDRAAAIAEAAQNAREAADLLARAIRLDATLDEPHSPDVVAGWHRRAGEALFEFGDPRQAIAHFRAALAQLDRPLPEGAMLAPRLLAEFWRTRRQPMGDGTPADRRARLLMAAEVLVRLSFLTYELQRHFQASYCTFRSLTLAKQAGGDSAALAIANVNMALASRSLPLIDGARHRDYAVGMAERIDEPACTLFVGWTAAAYDTAMGRFDEAVTNVRRALAAGVARRSARDVEALQVTLANTYRVLGRHWLGVEDLDAALASARDRGNVMYRIWSLGQLCRSHIARGDLDAFHRHLAEYRTMMTDGDARATASDFNRVVHATSEAQAHLVAGDPHSAARWIDEAVGIAQKITVPQFYFMEVPGALGDALLWAWRLSPSPGLARLARRNARLARRLGRLYPGIGPQIAMTRGDLAYLSGRHKAAGRDWRAAAAEAVARGLPALEGQALGRLALPATGADPDRARAEAEAAFARLGGTPPFPLRQVSWPPGPGPTEALP